MHLAESRQAVADLGLVNDDELTSAVSDKTAMSYISVLHANVSGVSGRGVSQA